MEFTRRERSERVGWNDMLSTPVQQIGPWARCRARALKSLRADEASPTFRSGLQGFEIPLVLLLQHVTICPASTSRTSLDEFSVAKLALWCCVCLRIGTGKNGAKDV